jgi:hypothetical protein
MAYPKQDQLDQIGEEYAKWKGLSQPPLIPLGAVRGTFKYTVAELAWQLRILEQPQKVRVLLSQ